MDTYEVFRKWVPLVTEQDKVAVVKILTGTEDTLGNLTISYYLKLLLPYFETIMQRELLHELSQTDRLASGYVFFYGCLLYACHFPNPAIHIPQLIRFNLLYILLDHYVDNCTPEELRRSLPQMYILLKDPHVPVDYHHPFLKYIAVIYQDLICISPHAKASLLTLFEAEIKGCQIQSSSRHDRRAYYDIALRKGGNTIQVLPYIVDPIASSTGICSPEINAAAYLIGGIIQLIDDSIDVYIDMENNIHTIATHELAITGNLDTLWYEIIRLLETLSPQFNIFRVVYSIFAAYIPDRVPVYSEDLRALTTKHNMFDYRKGCDGSQLLARYIRYEIDSWIYYPI
jgi:hypothetical protein